MAGTTDCEIPPKLLQHLLQEFLADKKTRISQPALDALGEYFKTFIREAIWRAAALRKESDDPEGPVRNLVGGGTVFLEVGPRPQRWPACG